MYVYQVSCGDECWSEHYQLIHEKKYSEAQFNKIIEEALFHALLKFAKPKSKWTQERKPEFGTLISDTIQRKNRKTKEYDYKSPFLDFLKERGFSRLEFEQKWNVYSGDSPLNIYKRGSTEDSKKVNEISKRIQRKFFKANPSYKEDMKEGERREEAENEKLLKQYRKEEEKLQKKMKKMEEKENEQKTENES